jgi:type IV pilus assembly protein PilQ
MLETRKIWTVVTACAAFALATSGPALADPRNEVRAVTYDEDVATGTTRVHVRGAQTPTFTVYKLERPSRVVIDLPQAQLADALRGHEGATTLSSNTWAVSTIAAQQLDDGGAVVRVIVTLARPGRYDVKTDANEVVVMVQARDPVPKTASPEELAAAQRDAEQAKQQAAHLREVADQAQHAADAAKQQAAQASKAEVDKAKADAAAADRRAQAAQSAAQQATDAAVTAQAQADRQRDAAEHAKQVALAEAARAKQEAGASKAEAEAARQQASAAQQQASVAQQQVGASKAEAAAAQQRASDAQHQAAVARDDAAREKAAAEQARAEVEAAQQAKVAAQADADRQIAQAKADAARAQQALRAEAEQAKAEAAAARKDAETARASAAADRKQADADRQKAELLMHDAKQQLGALDQKMAAAQAMEDKARAAHAAAEAREETAREAVERAQSERIAAETAAQHAAAAAKQAAEQRDQTSNEAKAERARLAAEAKAADDRLAQAGKATSDAEARKAAAETAAAAAKRDLEASRGQLATVEDARSRAEQAASEAARKRSDAETAARDATNRRDEAETAASQAARHRDEAVAAAQAAAQQRGEAEAKRLVAERERVAAEEAAHTAQAAKDAAERQRAIAEAAAGKATQSRDRAEASLAELTARQAQAEHAAADLEARTKAAAKAQAEVAAAEARKAGEAELAKARTEATRLAADRGRAEAELADRRKAVANQQAETEQLKVAAADARASADREEARRAQLARQRADEEQALAKVEQQRQAAEAAAKAAKPLQVAATPPAKAAQPTTPAAPAGKPAPPRTKASVGSIAFDGDAAAGRVEIDMTGGADVKLGEVTAHMVELVIDNAELAQKLERKLDVVSYGSPVRTVSTFRDRRNPARVRLLAEVSSPVTPTIQTTSRGVVWVLGNTTVAKAPPPPPPATTLHGHTQEMPTPVVGGFGATSTPVAQQSVAQLAPQGSRRRIYHGATVDFDFKDAPIHDLLRTIAEVGHVNIVVPDTITAKVTVRLKKVPWDQALEVVLSSYGLWYRLEGNLYRIAPRKELDAEDEQEAARRAARVAAESPRPDVVTLNYASAEELKGKLESQLSPKGKIEVDERTNALIINDVSGNREQIQQLALRLDTQTPQISIEARIVEADSDFKRQLGVQWGGNLLSGAQWGNATGLIFPSTATLTGADTDGNTPGSGVASPSNFAVNLPAATGTGEGGGIGLSLGSLTNVLDINLRLSALEDTSTVRIISAPKITVLNNKEAKISQGVSIPISVVSAAGTQTQFVQADLSLTVQPYVSQRDCAIAMKLLVTKNEPDFQQTGARGDPTILRKEARTTMLVQDGETAVLGGIYTRNSGVQYKKVPGFAELPVIGWLFKNKSENDDRTEVLVFITPKITNKASLRCQ